MIALTTDSLISENSTYRADSDQLLDFSLQGPVAGPDPWKKRLDLIEARAAWVR